MLRKIEELLPWLYLKSTSSGDFSEALTGHGGTQYTGIVGIGQMPVNSLNSLRDQ